MDLTKNEEAFLASRPNSPPLRKGPNLFVGKTLSMFSRKKMFVFLQERTSNAHHLYHLFTPGNKRT